MPYHKDIQSKLLRLKSEQRISKVIQSQQFNLNNNDDLKFQQTNIQLRRSMTRKTLSKYKNMVQKKHNNQQQSTINNLLNQNQSLKQQIIQIKLSQFYQFDQQKLKALLSQVENLKKLLHQHQILLQSTRMENQILKKNNIQLKQQIEKINKNNSVNKITEINNKTLAKTSKITKQDQQLTLKVIQKPILKSSHTFGNFQEYRLLFETDLQTKKLKITHQSQQQNEYVLPLQNKKRISNPQTNKIYQQKVQRLPKQLDYLNYKSKRKIQNRIKTQI